MVNSHDYAGLPGLLRLPREVRDLILHFIFAPSIAQTDWDLGSYLFEDYVRPGELAPRPNYHSYTVLRQPIRRVNQQLHAESTDMQRQLLSTEPFRTGQSRSSQVYNFLNAAPLGLCSIISGITLSQSAYHGNSQKLNCPYWDEIGTRGHLGQFMLTRLPNVRWVRIAAPADQRSNPMHIATPWADWPPEQNLSTLYRCTEFFAEALRDGRIDKLEFCIHRPISQTHSGEILPTDVAYQYWAGNDEPWQHFHKACTSEPDGVCDSRAEPSLVFSRNTSKTWYVVYSRRE